MAENRFCSISAGIVAGFSFVQMILTAINIEYINGFVAYQSLLNEVILLLTGAFSSAMLSMNDDPSYVWLRIAQWTVTVGVYVNISYVTANYPFLGMIDLKRLQLNLIEAEFAFGIMFFIALPGYILYTGFTDSQDHRLTLNS